MKIKELLSDESKWTQNAYARDKNNKPVLPNNVNAVKWCLLGAVDKCYRKKSAHDYILDLLITNLGPYIMSWNDPSFRVFEHVHKLVHELDI